MFDLENRKISVSRKTIKISDPSKKEYYISSNFKLCIVNNGSALWEIGDDLYSINAGDVVILDSFQRRAFVTTDEDIGLDITIIDFEPQFVINTPFMELFFRDDKFNRKISNHAKILKLAKEIEQESENNLLNYHLIIGSKLIEIFAYIGRHFSISKANSTNMNEDICRALEYIKFNYHSNISLSHVAQLLHISPTSFSRQFSKSMKIGFAQYVMHKRIHHAIHLLEKTNKTVLDISLECGFNNTANFYKAFRKITNNAPNDYRNHKRNNNV